MKKLLSLLLCFLLLFAVGCKEKTPEPTTYVEDGITQSNLSYIEDVYFSNGNICVTHASSIGGLIHDEDPPYSEKWVNERWVPSGLFDRPLRASLGGSSEMPIIYKIDRDPDGAAGRYRLSWGERPLKQDKDGNYYYEYDPDVTYLVCYVTIPEEGKYTAALPPTPKPTIEAAFSQAEEGMQLQITLQNHTDQPFYAEADGWKLQYHTGGWFDPFVIGGECDYPESLTVLPGEVYSCTLPLYRASEKPTTSMKAGRYRVVCEGNLGEKDRVLYAYFDWEEA